MRFSTLVRSRRLRGRHHDARHCLRHEVLDVRRPPGQATSPQGEASDGRIAWLHEPFSPADDVGQRGRTCRQQQALVAASILRPRCDQSSPCPSTLATDVHRRAAATDSQKTDHSQQSHPPGIVPCLQPTSAIRCPLMESSAGVPGARW